ncbi:primase-helicase family protein [Dysgonomonas sp. ZJ709]|uniref:primase-helicase family protein n=1 Tax=Dysgonomonas sp. ZJ709 TaxID=2709797 RepID=UPI0013ED4F30|nr:primase-helicase family protein [Dysgonomonas sp. ZJ709]
MKEEITDKYLRVGTNLYKIVRRPLISKDFIEERRPWNYETLRQDHSKDFISTIEKYDGFCSVPDHVNYQRSIGKFLNQYEPIPHKPIEGSCTVTFDILSHIFGEQFEIGLDYLQLLYLKPLYRLPILLLVSKDRNTGKTTFLNFLKAIFAGNMTFNTNEDFRSQFNSDWANKLIVAVDEVLLDRREDSERIKNLSTAISYKSEAKGKDRSEVEFFAKFILCSNNENCPILIDQGETRYWVRKIPTLQKENDKMLELLKKEIPHFLYYLQHRPLSTKSESRMWFRNDLLVTDALRKIIHYNKGKVETEMQYIILEIMEIKELDEYKFCVTDIHDMMMRISMKTDTIQIRRILQDKWKLQPDKTTRYTAYVLGANNDILEIQKSARIYRISRQYLDEIMLLC